MPGEAHFLFSNRCLTSLSLIRSLFNGQYCVMASMHFWSCSPLSWNVCRWLVSFMTYTFRTERKLLQGAWILNSFHCRMLGCSIAGTFHAVLLVSESELFLDRNIYTHVWITLVEFFLWSQYLLNLNYRN